MLALSADRLVVQANESATITATVQDPNGNPVQDGINVTFRLTAAPEGTSINPPSGTTTNGQVQTTLTAGSTAGTATIEAEAVDVVVGRFFRATNRLNIAVGVTVALQQLTIVTKTLVVSDTNATDPALRKPLDPNKENKTVVRAQVSGTAGLPIPVILDSSDDKSLWVDRRDPSRRALKQITLTVDANGEAEAIFYASTARALPANPVTIRASLDPTFPPGQTLSDTIVQEPGPPAQVALALTGFGRAADGTPYLTIPTTGTVSGTFIATVTDANNNGIPNAIVNFALSPDLPGTDEGTLSATQQTTDTDGKTPSVTLTASNFTTEVTLTATANGASASQKIRYSVSLTGVTIVGNPAQIPDDGTTTSTISVTGTPAFRQGLKFQLAADLGSTLTADGTADARSLVVEVGNNNPAGEGINEARAILKGPQPDLSQTTNRTITLTASLIVDGTSRDFTGTVTLLPRIQVTSNFGLSNNPNRLVVSSSNDLDPTNRIALDGVIGHNKATLRVIVNGAAAPNPRLVTFSSTDGAVLYEVKQGDNVGFRQIGGISGNLVQVGAQWIYEVDMYSSTVAAPSVTVNVNVLGINRSIVFEQVSGLPAQVVVSPARFAIGVTGHPTLPTSTNVQAIVRDAAGNLVTTPGITVFFTADIGTLNPPSAPAVNGIATTILTSTAETRQVRVFARAVAPTGAEATGVSTVVFAVGQVNLIQLRADRAADPQGNVPVPAGEIVRVTAVFSPSGSVPDNVRVQASLVGAYGIIQTISPTSNNQAEIVVFNNNTNDADSNSRVKVFVYDQSGQLVASPELTLIMKGVVTPPAVSLATDQAALVVSTTNDTTKANRLALPPHAGGPSMNFATLTLTVRNLSAGQQVQFQLRATDPNGLFVFPTTATTGELGAKTFTITDDGTNDTDPADGVIRTQVEYYSSRKSQTVIVSAEVRKGAGFSDLHGRASITIVQEAGEVAQSFFTVDPPFLAVNTLAGKEPIESRLIATLLDANDNPVPNERVSFAIEPLSVVPYSDVLAGNANNIILTRYDLPSITERFRASSGNIYTEVLATGNAQRQTFSGWLLNTPIALSTVFVRTVILLTPDEPQDIGDGDGVVRGFSAQLENRPVEPGSVIVTTLINGRTVRVRDDGNGRLFEPTATTVGPVTIGTGDGSQTTFTATLDPVPIYPNSIRIESRDTAGGRLEVIDDGRGNLIGDVDVDGTNAIGYGNGNLVVTFSRPPGVNRAVQVTYTTAMAVGTIDYSSGAINITFSLPPDDDADVLVAYQYRAELVLSDPWGSGGLRGYLDQTLMAVGNVDYLTGAISLNFFMAPPARGAPIFVTYRDEIDWTSGGAPDPGAFLGHLWFDPFFIFPPFRLPPSVPPLVSDGSIYPQSEGVTDTNGVAITFLRAANVSQPVILKMVPQSKVDLLRRFFSFYYVPVSTVQISFIQGALVNGPGATVVVEFRFNPPEALPMGSRVWVRVHGTVYDGDDDNDGFINEDLVGWLNPDDDVDGRVDEDPIGDANGDGEANDDGDLQTDEDPSGPTDADDDEDGLSEEDWNCELFDMWITNDNAFGGFGRVEIVAPGVVRVTLQSLPPGQGPDPGAGWKVIQLFFWNKDGIRMMAQTSAIVFD